MLYTSGRNVLAMILWFYLAGRVSFIYAPALGESPR